MTASGPTVPMRGEAIITEHRSHGSVWKAGDLIAGTEQVRDWRGRSREQFSVLLCTRERTLGPRGGRGEPAHSVTIVGPSWVSVCRAIESLGFERPRLTASQVRTGPTSYSASTEQS